MNSVRPTWCIRYRAVDAYSYVCLFAITNSGPEFPLLFPAAFGVGAILRENNVAFHYIGVTYVYYSPIVKA